MKSHVYQGVTFPNHCFADECGKRSDDPIHIEWVPQAGEDPAADVQWISQWVDGSPKYTGISGELAMWRRCAKVITELGEAFEELFTYVDENPRKDRDPAARAAAYERAQTEMLDVALAALAAHEHLTGNHGTTWNALVGHVSKVRARAESASIATQGREKPPARGMVCEEHGPGAPRADLSIQVPASTPTPAPLPGGAA